ncbi:MAG: hypothetical protein KDB27_20500 [Planctomycetales bacterium]|nr:hypothetical protein [Planctomycetales bacterium]
MAFVRKTSLLSIVLVVVCAQVASAQRGGGGRRGMFSASRTQLVANEKVQAELKINDEQKALVEEVNEKLREERRSLFQGGGDRAEMREKMAKMNDEAAEKIIAKLDDNQKKRLTEIYIQVADGNALLDKAVAKELNVDEEQQKKLEDASEKNREEMTAAFQDFRDMSAEERQETSTKLRRESNERLLAVLTAEQKEQFGKLKGEKFEIDVTELFGRRGGRGGQGGGNRGDRRPE